jgi:hypothetical protein
VTHEQAAHTRKFRDELLPIGGALFDQRLYREKYNDMAGISPAMSIEHCVNRVQPLNGRLSRRRSDAGW